MLLLYDDLVNKEETRFSGSRVPARKFCMAICIDLKVFCAGWLELQGVVLASVSFVHLAFDLDIHVCEFGEVLAILGSVNSEVLALMIQSYLNTIVLRVTSEYSTPPMSTTAVNG